MPPEWGSRETILVVDDDRAVSAALKRQLGRGGYIVHCVGDGAAALAFAQGGTVDLVILDLVMPGMSGIETCRALRLLPGWGEIPVLVLTGSYDEKLYAEALDCGADDFLTKPVRTEELQLRVKSLIRIRGLMTDLRTSVATIGAQNEIILRTREERERLQAFLLHDLKNPIAGILLQAEMMVTQETRPAAAWNRVLTGAEHLLRLVTSWMDHIKAEHTGIRPSLAEVPLRPFLEGILARHDLWLKVRKIHGVVEVEDADLHHPMDPVLMDRVLGNLLDNCLRYSPDGGTLLLGAGRHEGDGLHLYVSDQGPGVPEAMREGMFDLYVQLETSASHAHNRHNRGLGLAFCKAAVDSHGGRIWVDDNPGGGSRFNIVLPIPRPAGPG
ncbi:response regulator [Geothrix sp. 21YS21S-2]|uniref:hybrid sensor histidine kinase/response regulator n=1 Tax=Geothrix sp. 21YS21S-2 TaxID=3068893 RepID=UPI0027B979CB|nr:response regulator [Geothrix sp. 21YS21S-2]